MKIQQTNKIAGFNSKIELFSSTGKRFYMDDSTSAISQYRADQNVYRKVLSYSTRALSYVKTARDFGLNSWEQQRINIAKVTVKDLEQIVEKLRENIDTGSLDKQCKEL